MALELYKPNQGVYARAVSGVSGGIMAVFGAYQLHQTLIDLPPLSPGARFVVELNWGLAIALAVFAVIGGLVALIVTGAALGIKKVDRFSKASVDFLIETEAELKKVSWPNREELTGSTFIVVFVTIILGLYIVSVDFVVSSFMRNFGIL